ncbi:MAG: nucleotidyltransferase family protein [Lachnospiraceae bacterium]|nr:nucleotidyltransferase family protein [Lachnospiraceae bacterium]
MKVTGIIAEYNPFHNGHEYHLAETRKRLKSDYIIVVMSGNYVQRGAPTIIDKYSRAEMALKAGADLVLELPTCFATASAEYFAYGGVAILDKLNIVDDLCFGTESLDTLDPAASKEGVKVAVQDITDQFGKIADLLVDEPEEFKEILRKGLKEGLSHAAARSKAVGEILGEDYVTVMETSNNILGIEYMKALKKLGSNIKPDPIARRLTAHNDMAISEGFSSATAIRNAIYNKYDVNSLSATLPQYAVDILTDKYLVNFPIFRDDFSMILGAELLKANEPSDLTKFFGVSEDLANRILNLKNDFKSFIQFREDVATKSITKATVSRALMHIALGITDADMRELYSAEAIKYVKVLGFRKGSENLLGEIKRNSDIFMVTKLSDVVRGDGKKDKMLMQNVAADEMYRMVAMNKFDSDLKNPFTEEIVLI